MPLCGWLPCRCCQENFDEASCDEDKLEDINMFVHQWELVDVMAAKVVQPAFRRARWS